jgi:hypothetical protein
LNSALPGFITYDSGAITIDLSKLTGSSKAVIGANATASCIGSITTVTFLDTVGSITELDIGDSAFAQLYIPATVTAVTFPASLSVLSLGSYAFQQEAGGGAATLTHVTFPTTVSSLSLGVGAFLQKNKTAAALSTLTLPTTANSIILGDWSFEQNVAGDTALSQLSFPSTLVTLSVGAGAFKQEGTFGETTLASITLPTHVDDLTLAAWAFEQNSDVTSPLRTVTFPAEVGTLSIGYCAFKRRNESQLSRLIFPFTTAPTSVTLGSEIAPSGTDWVWFGADGDTDSEWNANTTLDSLAPLATPTYRLLGYRILSYQTNGGVLTSATSVRPMAPAGTLRYIYPDGTSRSAPGVFTLGATLGTWQTTLSTATKDGAVLTGWCLTLGCVDPLPAGTIISVSAAAIPVYAVWTVTTAPRITTVALPQGTVGSRYSQTISTSGAPPISCSVTQGQLPTGLALSGCTLSGTPTTAATYSFAITARNPYGANTHSYTVTIAAAASEDHTLAATGAEGMVLLLGAGSLLIVAGLLLRRQRNQQ